MGQCKRDTRETENLFLFTTLGLVNNSESQWTLDQMIKTMGKHSALNPSHTSLVIKTG